MAHFRTNALTSSPWAMASSTNAAHSVGVKRIDRGSRDSASGFLTGSFTHATRSAFASATRSLMTPTTRDDFL